jgi:hypothetical protein
MTAYLSFLISSPFLAPDGPQYRGIVTHFFKTARSRMMDHKKGNANQYSGY